MASVAKIQQQRSGKMVILRVQHKAGLASQYRDRSARRKTLFFGLAQVGNEGYLGAVQGWGAQDADAPRLDQPANTGRAAGGQATGRGGHFGLVIGHQSRTKGDQLQRQS